jgi:hypothetical protein
MGVMVPYIRHGAALCLCKGRKNPLDMNFEEQKLIDRKQLLMHLLL